tara:strand:- start:39375 stop:40637 length:1263 start_codon:yes stop_codon:yes gene_type:complete
VFVDNDIPFAWNTGFMYSLLLESTFVRINSRGLQHSQIPIDIEESKWNRAFCRPTPNAFCEFSEKNETMLMFPNTVVDMPDNFELLQPQTHPFLKHFGKTDYSPCTYKYSNRVINAGDLRYEVSLCDVLNANLDFVLDLKENMIYWREDTTSTFLYVMYSILAIYLISLMTNNIINILTKKESSQEIKEEKQTGGFQAKIQDLKIYSYLLFLAFTLVVLLRMSLFELFNTGTLITFQDKCIVTILSIYCLVQFVYHYIIPIIIRKKINWIEPYNSEEIDSLIPNTSTTAKPDDERDKSFSLLVAFILLLIMLVYKTFDTPYLTLMTTLFLMRSWQKMFLLTGETSKEEPFKEETSKFKHWFLIFSTWLDFFVAINLILIVYSSMRVGSYLTSSMQAYLHIFAILLTSLILSLGMQEIIKA